MPFSLANDSAAKALHHRFLEPLLHVGFALTGIGTVLLGCILPQVSLAWHLQDKDAGLLLLVQFATSASGALLVRRNLWKTLACGYGLFALGAFSIFLLQHKSFPTFVFAFGGYGLGLGMAMTSTNMIFGRRYPNSRGAALAILNFSWSAGAVACPLVAAQFRQHTGSGDAFGLLGLVVAPFALIPLIAERGDRATPVRSHPPPTGIKEATTILYFALLAFLYVGIEATVGNWLSTYATRAASWNFAGSTVTVAVFWVALLLGRALTPAMLTVLSERRLYRASLVVVIAGLSLFLAAHSPGTVLAASGLTGLALAPLFPLTLSLFLAEIRESNNAGWVFAVAGLGGAVLSWLTGIISTGTGSLRIALLVPGTAALVMTGMIAWRRARSESGPAVAARVVNRPQFFQDSE